MKKLPVIIVLFILSVHTLRAQDNMVFLGRNTPQKYLINPALNPDDRFFLTFPFIGGLTEQLNANIGYSDIFALNSNNKTTIRPDLLASLKDNNQIRNILNMDLIHLGFKIGRTSFMGISVRARTTLDADISKDVFSFIMDNPIDKNRQFQLHIAPDALSWAEAGIAFTQKVSKNVTIGLRVKGLLGYASAQAGDLTIVADKSYDKYTLSGNIDLKTGNLNLKKKEELDGSGNYDESKKTFDVKNFSSPGFSLDLGVSYLSDNKRLNVYASVSDFGRIYWSDEYSTQIVNRHPAVKYEWTGVKNIDDIINGNSNFKDQLENTLDEMTAAIGLDTVRTSFESTLPLNLQAGAKYACDPGLKHNISLNMLFILPQYAKMYYELTAGYTYSTKNKRWDLMGAYTYKSLAPFNIGIGGLYRGRGFELFLMTDSINSFFNYKKARSATFRFGMNFYCGRNKIQNRTKYKYYE